MKNKLMLPLKNKFYLRILILVISLLIAAGGYLFYKQQADTLRREKYNELKAIADLKESQIENWLDERKGDAKVFPQSPFFSDGINRWLQDKGNLKLKNDIIKRLKPLHEELGYKNIFLANTNGDILLSATDDFVEIDAFLKQKITESSLNSEIVFTDFYLDQKENKIYFDIISPIISSENKTIAVMVFRMDPNDFLIPLIQTWPIPSKSAETAILRLENDSVIFLNEMRHRKNAILKLKIPLTQTENPAVQAALGHTGLFEGIDGRGVEVLSDIRTIAGANWIMLSKVDKREVYAGLKLTAGIITGFTILLIIVCGIGFAFIYNSQQKTIYLELYSKEKELWGQQEKFKVTMDSLGEGVITLDINGKVQYMNNLAEEMTGWKLREARGRELHDIYPVKNEETGQRENNILDKIHKHGIVKELANHTLLISKSGKEIPVMDTGAPVYDNDGTVTGIVIAFQDETEKRHQQKLIKESEKKYKSLIENSQDTILINYNNQFVYVNPAGLKLFAAENENQILGKTLFDFFHPDYHELIKSCIAKEKGNGTAKYIEEKIINLKGEVVDVEVATIPYTYKNNKALQVIIRDITERKLADEKIIQNELRLIEAQRIAKLANWELDLSTNYLTWSDEIYSIFEIDKEKFDTSYDAFLDAIHPDDRDTVNNAYKDSIKNRTSYSLDHRLLLKDGRIKFVHEQWENFYDENGNPIKSIGTLHDITERKLGEEKIRMRTVDLGLINSLNYAINRGDKLDEIANLLSKEIMRIFNCLGTIISFPNPEKNFLLPTHIQFPSPLPGKLEKLIGASFHKLPLKIALKGNGKIASAMREGFPKVFNDESEIIEMIAEFTETNKLKRPAPSVFKLLHLQSMVVIPLVSENEIYGMFGFIRAVQTSDEELNRLKALAGQLTQAIGRKLAEEKVIDERNNATQYFETAGIMLVILDKSGKVIRINKKGCDVLHYAESEITGKYWFEFLPEKHAQELRTSFKQLMNGEIEGLEFDEYPIVNQKGEERLIEWHNVILRDTDGKPIGTLSSGEDITAKKQNEKFIITQRDFGITTSALRDLDELYRISMESFFNLSGMECGMIYLFDEEMKKLNMVFSKGLSEPFVSVASLYNENSDHVKFVKLGKPAFVSYNELTIESSEIERAEKLVSLAILPIVNKGKVIGCINLASHRSISIPVTLQKSMEVIVTLISNAIVRINAEDEIRNLNASLEIKVEERTEQLAQAKTEAERANLAKSEFLSRMSHELRTPLNSILGFAQLLNRSETNPERKNRIDQIMKSGMHLLVLINEVLDLAQIESGKLSLSLEPVQLSGIIMETLDIVQPIAEKRDVKLKFADSPVNNLYVKADRQKLKQVMINLINNAVKYNRQGGEVEVSITQTGKSIRIGIRDTGVGIAPEELHKLFEPFQRIGYEISEVEGTGLGLAVAKKLMDAMNGTIGVESEVGIGSTFWIELPQTISQMEHNVQTHQSAEPDTLKTYGSGTILYIEDNISNIQLVEDILGAERPNVRLVAEMYGKNAVKMATDYQPGLILLDLDLSDIHGSIVLKLLQTDPATKSIPVVVLSADAIAYTIEKLLAAGAKQYLTKPLDVENFLQMVDEIMNRG